MFRGTHLADVVEAGEGRNVHQRFSDQLERGVRREEAVGVVGPGIGFKDCRPCCFCAAVKLQGYLADKKLHPP